MNAACDDHNPTIPARKSWQKSAGLHDLIKSTQNNSNKTAVGKRIDKENMLCPYVEIPLNEVVRVSWVVSQRHKYKRRTEEM